MGGSLLPPLTLARCPYLSSLFVDEWLTRLCFLLQTVLMMNCSLSAKTTRLLSHSLLLASNHQWMKSSLVRLTLNNPETKSEGIHQTYFRPTYCSSTQGNSYSLKVSKSHSQCIWTWRSSRFAIVRRNQLRIWACLVYWLGGSHCDAFGPWTHVDSGCFDEGLYQRAVVVEVRHIHMMLLCCQGPLAHDHSDLRS